MDEITTKSVLATEQTNVTVSPIAVDAKDPPVPVVES